MSMADTLIQAIGWILIVAGSFFTIVGAFGIWRFPDFWSRLHAASITDSAGVILLLAGMAVHAGLTLVTVKLIIIGAFLFITGPTATHAVANAALVSGLRPKIAKGLKSALDGPKGAPKAKARPKPKSARKKRK